MKSLKQFITEASSDYEPYTEYGMVNPDGHVFLGHKIQGETGTRWQIHDDICKEMGFKTDSIDGHYPNHLDAAMKAGCIRWGVSKYSKVPFVYLYLDNNEAKTRRIYKNLKMLVTKYFRPYQEDITIEVRNEHKLLEPFGGKWVPAKKILLSINKYLGLAEQKSKQ